MESLPVGDVRPAKAAQFRLNQEMTWFALRGRLGNVDQSNFLLIIYFACQHQTAPSKGHECDETVSATIRCAPQSGDFPDPRERSRGRGFLEGGLREMEEEPRDVVFLENSTLSLALPLSRCLKHRSRSPRRRGSRIGCICGGFRGELCRGGRPSWRIAV